MSSQTNDGVPIYRPKPRRPFELTPLTSTVPQGPGSDSRADLPAWINGDPLSPTSANGTTTPNDFTKRTKSVLNLTASTLFGIYSSTYNDGTEPPTPSSSSFMSRTNSMVNVSDTTSNGNANNVNGVEKSTNTNRNASSSPDQSPRRRRRRGKPTSLSRLVLRLSALLGFGIGYGVIVMHLHNTKTFTPAWWEEIEGYNPGYLLLWGLVGVALGSLLPWIDYFFDEQEDGATDGMVDWMQVVRSIGAFVGIAYAIRKLPWQSTLQISLTLSLVNPFLWYLVDRTRAGFLLSVFVGIAGTMILCQINPGMIQAPETYTDRLARQTAATTDKPEEMLMGYISYETVGVGAWMWSVLFCSCVCFGNIGRKLAFRERDL